MSQLGSHHHSLFAPIALFLFIFSLLPVSLGSTTWPLPLNATTGRRLLYFHRHFTFRTDGRPSSLLSKAFDRYTDIILDYSYPADDTSSTFGKALGELSSRDAIRCVVVEVVSSDQSLGLQTSETYTLRVAAPTTIIEATTVHGALRGLETLAQLAREVPVDSRTSVLLPADVTAEGLIGGDVNSDLDVIKEVLLQKAVDMLDPAAYDGVDRHHRRHHKHRRHRHRRLSVIKETAIYDTPRFRYRGLLIDSARHYLPVSIIKAQLDAMAMVKLNVLHWHLSDDQSFPFVSSRLPELSDHGAFSPSAVYTRDDVDEVVSYAHDRGIRVIPEFDTPGHVAAWGASHPELLTSCCDERGQPLGKGPMDPTMERTYTILWQLFRDVAKSFPDGFVHVGGDEVDQACWKSNADVQDWMKNQGYGRDYSRLQAYHTGRVVRLAEAAGKNAMVWQEAAEEPGIKNLPELTVVQVWKWAKDLGKVAQSAGLRGVEAAYKGQQAAALRGWPSAMQGALSWLTGAGASSSDDYWRSEMSRVTKTHRAVLSAPFYLNLAAPDEAAWEKYWQVEPASFSGTAEQKERMVGGEASVWGELVDATNALQKTWPLAAAVAERLWSDQSVQDLDTARERLQELRCRLMIRGIPAAPLGPGFCPSDVD